MSKEYIENGTRFGRLVVIKETDGIIRKNGNLERRLLCLCDCGKETIVSWGLLKSGNTRSCGCLKRDCGKGIIKNEIVDPLDRRLRKIWLNMKSRCNPKNHRYARNYYNRGITVCDEWKNNFTAFYKWAVLNGYSPLLSIDRIDNNKGYSPDNCRWATSQQQMNNVRYNKYLTVNNETHTCAEWSRILGVSPTAICRRIKKDWSDDMIINTPFRKRKNNG